MLHVSQIAAALGLPETAVNDPARLGRDAADVLGAWLSHLRELDFDLVTRPTPSRGRSLRNLTVNVFHPFELLPEAWKTGRFDWDPDRDAEREWQLVDAASVVHFAERAAAGWGGFLHESGEALELSDRLVGTPRGEVAYSSLLDFQRWHAAYHYRQLVTFLRAEDATPERVLPLGSLDLALPSDVY